MDKIRKLYSTGEFAKLCGVHKKTLFHYDSIGLLMPEKIMDNGYRYYSYNQLELFSVISILKELEMPLNEIKSFINSRNPENTNDLFITEKKLVEDKINNLKRIQKLLDVKLKIMDEALHCTDQISLEYEQEETLVFSNKINDDDAPYDVNTFTEHAKYCNAHNLSYGYPIGSTIDKQKLINNNYIVNDSIKYDYYFTKVPNLKSFNKFTKKAAGTYAVIYHKGYFDTVHDSYHRLLNFIKDENLSIDSCAYEEVLIDEVVTKNSDDYVLKISIKVI